LTDGQGCNYSIYYRSDPPALERRRRREGELKVNLPLERQRRKGWQEHSAERARMVGAKNIPSSSGWAVTTSALTDSTPPPSRLGLRLRASRVVTPL